MSVVTRYIDISSLNRDRGLYPSAASFNVRLDGTGPKNAIDASDPVSKHAAVIRLHTAFNQINPFTSSLAGALRLSGATYPIGAASAGVIVYCSFLDSTNLANKAIANFYAGAVLRMSSAPFNPRRIIKSEYMYTVSGTSIMRFQIETPFPDSVADATAIVINNPTDNSGPKALLFVPTSFNTINYYIGSAIDLTSNDPANLESTRFISNYDGSTRITTMHDVYEAPPFLAAGNELHLRPAYSMDLSPITAIDIAYNPANYANSTTQITLEGVVQNATVGSFIRVVKSPTAGVGSVTLRTSEIRRINTTVVRNIVPTGGGGSTQNTTIGFSAMSFTPSSPDTYEILPFSFDNSRTLAFSGNINSLASSTCYEIKLLNLLLPNTITILNGHGGKFTAYPYVWVELRGISSNVKNAMWSNSSSSTLMLFKIPVKDVKNPIASKYLKLDGLGVTQFIQFTPVDEFQFSVRLPDGTVPDLGPDLASPALPEFSTWISATFEIRRRV